MGYAGTWIGIKGKSPEEVHAALGLKHAPKSEDYVPDAIEAIAMPNGWYLIFSRDEDLHTGPIPPEISKGCECVTFFGEEHVMFSATAYWKNGHQVWSVQHNSEQGIRHLDKQGEMPSFVAAIEAKQIAEQDKEEADPGQIGVDYIYDVPLDIAEHLTGYNYSEEPEFDSEDPYHTLVKDASNPKPYFKERSIAKGAIGCVLAIILILGVPATLIAIVIYQFATGVHK